MQTTLKTHTDAVFTAMREHGPDTLHAIARHAGITPFQCWDVITEHLGDVELDGNGCWTLISGEDPEEPLMRLTLALGDGQVYDMLTFDGTAWRALDGHEITGSTPLDNLAADALALGRTRR